MIEKDPKVLAHAKMLTCRFTLLKLRDQCSTLGLYYYSFRFIELLRNYDKGLELNENFLISLNKVKLVKNEKLIERLIKLIKIC